MSILKRFRDRHPEPSGVAKNPALAATILRRLKDNKPTLHNLTNKLNELDRGKPTWWNNRPDVLEVLADILGADPKELVGLQPRSATDQHLTVEEWPELGPLDLFDDELFAETTLVRPVGVRDHAARHDLLYGIAGLATPAWVVLPSGAGRSVVAAFHGARHGRELASAGYQRHLVNSQVADHVGDILPAPQRVPKAEWLVVDLRDFDEERDTAALPSHERADGLVVLSSAPLPASVNVDDGGTRWHVYEWSPVPGWESRFVDWITQRRTNVRQHQARLKDHLHTILRVSSGRLVPRDVLALAQASGWGGQPTLTAGRLLEAASKASLGRRLRRSGADATNRSWVQSSADKALRAALRKRWDGGGQWFGPTPSEDWQEAIPNDLAPGDKTGRRAASLMAVEALRDTGLLVTAPEDGLAVFSSLLELSWTLEHVRDSILRASEAEGLQHREALGCASIGSRRRPLFDLVLDELSDEVLRKLVVGLSRTHRAKGLTTAASPSTLGLMALREALFSAVGRRFDRGWKPEPRENDAFIELLETVWAGVVRRGEQKAPALVTRPGVGDGTETGLRDEVNAFIADCWAWSAQFKDKKPARLEVPANDRWLFPYWFDSIDEPKQGGIDVPAGWSDARADRPFALTEHHPHFNRLLNQVDELAKKMLEGRRTAAVWQLPQFHGRFMIQAALADRPDPSARPLQQSSGQEGWFLDFFQRLERLHDDDKPKVAKWLFRNTAVDSGRQDVPAPTSPDEAPLYPRLLVLARLSGGLGEWIIRRLSVAELDEVRARCGLAFVANERTPSVFSLLPPELRRALIGWLAEDPRALEQMRLGLIRHHDWGDVDTVIALLPVLGDKAFLMFRRLWEIAPEKATELLRENLASSDPAMRQQAAIGLANAGFGHASEVAEILLSVEASLLPEWIPAWAHRVITRGDAGAANAWTLLQRFLAGSAPAQDRRHHRS